MILIAGGTGRLGTLVVRRLVGRGLEVRVLTRDPARARHLAGERVTVVQGDVRDGSSLESATAGTDVTVSAVHGLVGPRDNSPATVDRDGNANLVDAAKAAGSDFVLLSTVGATADHPMELFRMKHAAEQHAIGSGIPSTIVRATAFLELWIELLGKTAGRGGRPLVFGRGTNPINFVSVADVAALVELAVVDPSTRGSILEIGGPADLTLNQLARALQASAGRNGAPRHLPPAMLRLMADSVGRINPQLGRQARAALAMDRTDLTFDAAPVHRRYPDLPCRDVADVLAGSVGG
jgi:NADH dehydrogenase